MNAARTAEQERVVSAIPELRNDYCLSGIHDWVNICVWEGGRRRVWGRVCVGVCACSLCVVHWGLSGDNTSVANKSE